MRRNCFDGDLKKKIYKINKIHIRIPWNLINLNHYETCGDSYFFKYSFKVRCRNEHTASLLSTFFESSVLSSSFQTWLSLGCHLGCYLAYVMCLGHLVGHLIVIQAVTWVLQSSCHLGCNLQVVLGADVWGVDFCNNCNSCHLGCHLCCQVR